MATRRAGYDSMMWQAPGLGLAAQAFLMTIALHPDTGRLAQVTAGMLSMVVSFMSVQLLAKHRRHELADSIWLQELERTRGLPQVHAPAERRCRDAGMPSKGLVKFRSHQVWTAGLVVFGLAGLATAIVGFVRG
ncbi:hypothetical protein EJ357_22040 [Streptomyces cyaneochromogenes]|uniref:Uncharacterized protein n=1 Tax=Streptomyces cyaneochromogenes TaxID=2496836 RepID=A0A3Q9EU37_9ACTN|nr:hypothetical protein [Streptomyces cyaneochromogenes]AZQ35838.1 hypothetical protein EJ357_22040 [Streptomyces cyaneochromogenes]